MTLNKRLIIHSKSHYGSANSIIAEELGLSLSKQGYYVTAVSISHDVSKSVSAYDISPTFTRILLPHYKIDRSILSFLRRGFIIAKFYKRLNADFILSLDPILPETFIPLLLGKLKRIPTAIYLTDNWGLDPDGPTSWSKQIIEEVMIIFSLKMTRVQFYASELVRNRLKKYGGRYSVIMRCGFNTEDISKRKSEKSRDWLNESFDIPKENKIILTRYDSRVSYLYTKIADEFRRHGSKVTLLLLNSGSEILQIDDNDDLISEGYMRIANKLNREEYVRAILNCDILWISGIDSFWDRARFPTRLPEYMASGVPVVCSIGGTSRDFLNQSGYSPISKFAFPSNDVSSILNSFSFMLSDNPLIKESCNATFNYANENLTWNKITSEFARILERLFD